ncbi:MAG: hypothetical protein UX52_C0008G0051, partial [Candidatus Amesbacteria bacterium GW2011_GWA1_46_35]
SLYAGIMIDTSGLAMKRLYYNDDVYENA